MGLSHYDPNSSNQLIKTMKIIQLEGNTVRTFPINEAYESLTKNAYYDITKQTKVVIHGFRDSANSAIPFDLAKAYNEKGIFNVFLVDAEEMLKEWYIRSVHNSKWIGKRLANLLANLETFGANADDLHVLGLSLGAHIAGWTGKYFFQFKNRHLGRITGLDPAGPCFSYAFSDQRLDKTDAKYVDVVHSNRLVQGVIEPLGHADFYLNGGGPHQPGCMSPTCSHLRAAVVYAESIRVPMAFVGVKCSNWDQFLVNSCDKEQISVLGYGSSTSSRGQYYLRTSSSAPYGLGMVGTNNTKKTLDWMNSLDFV